jgi:hypothetical protein
MDVYIKGSKLTAWVLLPVLLALLVSAIVGLQLFQDGSSYLLELLISHSAVRHNRVSIVLFQSPTIFLIKAVNRLPINPVVALPLWRLAFSLNYAITPFISLLLSWLVVRKEEERLFIWAALIILFVNLVNFSWVSELLISLQLSCPLLLALLQNPRSKTFWSLLFLLIPFIFFLHPLVITLFLVMAMVSAYVSYKRAAYRGSARLSMILFLLASALRGIYSLFTLSAYEVSFLAAGETRSYLISTSLENVLFLLIAVEIAFFILLSQSIINSRWFITKVAPWLISWQSLALLLFTARFFLRDNLSPLVLIGGLGVTALIYFRYPGNSAPIEKMRRLYMGYGIMAVAASTLLLAQYLWYERPFPLKTGLALLAALLIMTMAAIDSMRHPTAQEHVWRFRLVSALAIIFACVIIAKSLIWQASVYKLEQTLRQTEGSCAEIASADFQWLANNPYTIINNWALPSLALVVQDQQPRKLLLEQEGCQLYYQSGIVQVDPWSLIEKEYIVPPLE